MIKIKVGIFVAIGLTTLIISVFMLGSNKSYFQKSILITTYFDSVQGLNNGAIVSIAGVKIGNVESLEFDDEKNLVKVTFLIDESFAPKIKSDSVVEIRTQGALGDKFLFITPGMAKDFVQKNSVLKSEYGSDIISVFSKRGSESEKIFDTINNISKIVEGLAMQNKLPSVVSKLDSAAGNFNEASQKINAALKSGKLESSVNKLDRILEKIDNGQGTLGALINDKSVHERLRTILGAGQKQQQVKSILKSSTEE